jgi:hypothetical protein
VETCDLEADGSDQVVIMHVYNGTVLLVFVNSELSKRVRSIMRIQYNILYNIYVNELPVICFLSVISGG